MGLPPPRTLPPGAGCEAARRPAEAQGASVGRGARWRAGREPGGGLDAPTLAVHASVSTTMEGGPGHRTRSHTPARPGLAASPRCCGRGRERAEQEAGPSRGRRPPRPPRRLPDRSCPAAVGRGCPPLPGEHWAPSGRPGAAQPGLPSPSEATPAGHGGLRGRAPQLWALLVGCGALGARVSARGGAVGC